MVIRPRQKLKEEKYIKNSTGLFETKPGSLQNNLLICKLSKAFKFLLFTLNIENLKINIAIKIWDYMIF